jgi:hypothetical protein
MSEGEQTAEYVADRLVVRKHYLSFSCAQQKFDLFVSEDAAHRGHH